MFLRGGLHWQLPITQTRFCEVRKIARKWLRSHHCFTCLIIFFKVCNRLVSLLSGSSSLFNEPNSYFVFMAPLNFLALRADQPSKDTNQRHCTQWINLRRKYLLVKTVHVRQMVLTIYRSPCTRTGRLFFAHRPEKKKKKKVEF